MTLKDATWDHHKNAERQEFVSIMMSGNINPKFYAIFLWNLYQKYDILEALAGANGCLDNLPDIRRKMKIVTDYNTLWNEEKFGKPPTLPSTIKYIERLENIMYDKNALMAHVYVFHMGDLSGGQMISKKVPGLKSMFDFKGDIDTLKNTIRQKLNDSMVDEAKWAFDSATQLFKEMMDLDCEHYLEQTDSLSG